MLDNEYLNLKKQSEMNVNENIDMKVQIQELEDQI